LLRSFSADSLLAYDAVHRRVTIFDESGTLVRTFPMPEAGGHPMIVDVSAGGRVLVRVNPVFESGRAESGVHRPPVRLFEIDPTGIIVRELGTYPGDESFALSSGGNGLIVGPMVFGARLHAAVSDGLVAVGVGDEAELRFVTATETSRVPLGFDERRVDDGDFRAARDDYLSHVPPPGQGIERSRFEPMPRRPVLPFVADVRTDAQGNVWVRQELPPGDRRRMWTVFDGRGQVIARARLPDGSTPLEFGTGHLLILTQTEDGTELVQLHARRGTPDSCPSKFEAARH
jgi:hypothetical protein